MDYEDEVNANRIIYPFICVYAILLGIWGAFVGKGDALITFFVFVFIGWILTWLVTMVISVMLGIERKIGEEARDTAVYSCVIAAIAVPVLLFMGT